MPNEDGRQILIIAPDGMGCEISTTFQIAKIIWPLLSVTKMTCSGNINALCKRDEALVLDNQDRVLAVFKMKGSLYVADMKIRR